MILFRFFYQFYLFSAISVEPEHEPESGTWLNRKNERHSQDACYSSFRSFFQCLHSPNRNLLKMFRYINFLLYLHHVARAPALISKKRMTMTAIETLIYQIEGRQREVLLHFHHLLTNDYNLTSKITFKSPCYYGKSWICYLKPTKRNTVELTFLRGNELSNTHGLLQNNGRKQIRSIDIDHIANIQNNVLREILNEALLLDKTPPYEFKRKLKRTPVKKPRFEP